MRRITLEITVGADAKRETVEAWQVSKHFAAHKAYMGGGWALTHIRTGLRAGALQDCGLRCRKDAVALAGVLEELPVWDGDTMETLRRNAQRAYIGPHVIDKRRHNWRSYVAAA